MRQADKLLVARRHCIEAAAKDFTENGVSRFLRREVHTITKYATVLSAAISVQISLAAGAKIRAKLCQSDILLQKSCD